MSFRSIAILLLATTLSFHAASAQICPQIVTCSPSEIAAVAPDCRAAIESSCQRAELHALKLANAELEAMVGQLQEEKAAQAKFIGDLAELVRKLKKNSRRSKGKR